MPLVLTRAPCDAAALHVQHLGDGALAAAYRRRDLQLRVAGLGELEQARLYGQVRLIGSLELVICRIPLLAERRRGERQGGCVLLVLHGVSSTPWTWYGGLHRLGSRAARM